MTLNRTKLSLLMMHIPLSVPVGQHGPEIITINCTCDFVKMSATKKVSVPQLDII